MRTLNKFRIALVALVILSCVSILWAGCIDAVLGQIANEIKKGGSTSQDLDKIVAYTKNIDSSSDTGKGVVASISSRSAKGDGANRAAQIISNFPGAQDAIFSSLAPFREKPGFSDLVVGLGNPSVNTVTGSSEELRFATNRLGADQVKAFQVPLNGTIPDIQDISNNLFEIKARNYAGQADFIVAQDLGAIHDQATIALSQLTPGATLTLAFNTPLPPAAETLYQQIFQDLIANPNFTRINGF